MEPIRYFVIIATSQNRTHWLINRSLLSVYKQVGIKKSEWNVWIIDDNENENEFYKLKAQIPTLRDALSLKSNEFPTKVLRNQRSSFMSGTGAWNTGIFEIYKQYPESFISILDDDDEYLPNHLADCTHAIRENTVAVFQHLKWLNENSSFMHLEFTKKHLTAENFFIGNPGIQGSNMFFKTKSLVEIGGFDETLPNTTDRDLMIRFLWKNKLESIEVIESIGVIHHNHKNQRVNNNISKKHYGLDLFYRKYSAHFSKQAYQKSLERAKALFNYAPK